MGAIRFTGELQSRRGVLYAIEIWDESYASTSTDIRLSGDGFRLQYDAVGDSRTTPIIASRLTFGWQIRNATDEAFITDLLTAAEGRFTIKVTRNTVLFWVGYIQPDISILQDLAYPYRFDVTATDGLGRLKNFDYTTSGQTTFVQHILNCLTQDVLAARYYLSGDIFLRTSVDWWHTAHGAQTTAKDPLLLSRFDGVIFQKKNTDNTTDYQSCYAALFEMMTVWNARIYFSAGAYHVEQPDYRLTPTFNERRYGRTGTSISTSTVNYARSLPQSLTGAKQTGITFDWFPAIKNSFVEYNHSTAKNHLYSLSGLWGTGLTNASQSLGFQLVDTTTFFKINGSLRLNLVTSSTSPFYYIVRMNLEVGTKNFRRSITPNALKDVLKDGIATWGDTSGGLYYEIPAGYYYSGHFSGIVPFSIWTTTIPASGAVSIDFFTANAKDHNGNTVSLTTNEWYMENLSFEVVNGDTATNLETKRKYKFSNTNTGNSEVSTVQVIIGEAVKEWTPGKVSASPDGVTWTDTTTGWAEGGLSSDLRFGQLLCNSIMAGQDTPVQKMRGAIFGDDFYFHNLVSDLSGRKWLFMGGTFTAKTDTWNAEFWGVIYTAKTGGTIIKVSDFIPFLSTGATQFFPEKSIGNADPVQFVFENLASAKSGATLTAGAVTTVTLSAAVNAGAFVANQKIRIINPATGATDLLTVTATTGAGATTLAVSGTLSENYPVNAIIIKDDLANNASGGTASDGNGIYGGSGTLLANTVVTHTSNGYTLTLDSSADTSTPETLILKGNTSGTSTKGLKLTNQANTELAYLQSISGAAEVRLGTGTAVKLVLIGIAGTDIYADTKLVMAANTDGSVTLFGVTSEPGSPAEGSFWYNTTDNVLRLRRGSTTEIVKTGGTDASSGAATYTPGGADYTLILDANSNAITVTLGASMHEGMDYLIRCRRNGTNIITFNSDSGYTLTIDTVSTLNPTTLAAGGGGAGIYAPHKTYTMRRAGSVIHIR